MRAPFTMGIQGTMVTWLVQTMGIQGTMVAMGLAVHAHQLTDHQRVHGIERDDVDQLGRDAKVAERVIADAVGELVTVQLDAVFLAFTVRSIVAPHAHQRWPIPTLETMNLRHDLLLTVVDVPFVELDSHVILSIATPLSLIASRAW
jgi:hypothetical protein